MANVLFTRKNASEIPNVPITDGQLIFDTSGNGKMYLDNGTDRLVMGGALTVDATLSKTSTNPVQNKAVAGVMLDTLSDIGNVTSKGFLTDALAVKQLNTNVNELNNSLTAFLTSKKIKQVVSVSTGNKTSSQQFQDITGKINLSSYGFKTKPMVFVKAQYTCVASYDDISTTSFNYHLQALTSSRYVNASYCLIEFE